MCKVEPVGAAELPFFADAAFAVAADVFVARFVALALIFVICYSVVGGVQFSHTFKNFALFGF